MENEKNNHKTISELLVLLEMVGYTVENFNIKYDKKARPFSINMDLTIKDYLEELEKERHNNLIKFKEFI
jgi:hypothetical protein